MNHQRPSIIFLDKEDHIDEHCKIDGTYHHILAAMDIYIKFCAGWLTLGIQSPCQMMIGV